MSNAYHTLYLDFLWRGGKLGYYGRNQFLFVWGGLPIDLAEHFYANDFLLKYGVFG